MATSIADFVPAPAQRAMVGAVNVGRRGTALIRCLGSMVLFTACAVRAIPMVLARYRAEIARQMGELTLGTGVGSVLFQGGALYPNTEFGHLPLRGRSAERSISAAARKRRGLHWREWGAELGDYLHRLEELLWPELIIIGGGVSSKSKKFFPYVKTRARLVPASFHNEAGIVGAALWAAEKK